MKFNKIISSALCLIMLLSSIIAAIPMTVFAEEVPAVTVEMGEADKEINDPDNLSAMVNRYIKQNFATARDMLNSEKRSGYLDKVSAGGFNLYVNRYTGFVYYENTMTGQILTSNPYDPGSNKSGSLPKSVLSQLELEYKDVTDSSVSTGGVYDSMTQIQEGFNIVVSEIKPLPDGRAGLSVQYTMGVNAADFRVPRYITKSDYENHLVFPMFKKLADAVVQYCGELPVDYDLRDNTDIYRNSGRFNEGNVRDYLDLIMAEVSKDNPGYSVISKNVDGIKDLFSGYKSFISFDPNSTNEDNKILLETVPILNEGVSVYALKNNNLSTYRLVNNAILDVLGEEYTKENSKEDLDRTGYVVTEEVNSASFLVSINYTLNPEGELFFEVPMSAPYFVNNNPNYSIKSLTPLKFFGAGDINNDGYIFYPDGSGTVVEFDNIRTIQANYYSSTFGNDYGYASLTPLKAHLEQVTMPVYGMVSEVKANKETYDITKEDTVTNGFFAIVEEGSSLMNLTFASSSAQHKYAVTAASYLPHPMDMCDLSQTLSAAVTGKYYIVSESKYEGNYKTKIVMLTDEKLAAKQPNSYEPTYVGMANCYRDYLIRTGVIEKIEAENLSSSIPLYLEVLGAMDVTKKVMSFPVVMSTALTRFEDVGTMYNEFRGNGVNNINFRLTGFANGGMTATYPVKLKWQKSLGGKEGLANLLETSKRISSKNDGSNLGIFPDFDFLYIHDTAMFDGVSNRKIGAIMVDNRYASKQSFNAVLQLYESIFSIVVSPDSLDGLYDKFNSHYSEYNVPGLSVATLGSELNSNFDIDNSINRETSLAYTKSLLSKMSSQYSLMTDVGNVYSMKYVDHVLNAPTDSSHYKYSSYTVPFYGMVFHGYVNYAGSPLNYTGSPDYDILRAIESGAALQYILCYDNTHYLKADKTLSKYYGVDYKNWKDIIISQYNKLNTAIGTLQDNVITDHKTIVAERVVTEEQRFINYSIIIDEFLDIASMQFEQKISNIATDLRLNGGFEGKTALVADVEKGALENMLFKALNTTSALANMEILTDAELEALGASHMPQYTTLYDVVKYKINTLSEKFEEAYPGADDADNNYEIRLTSADINYKSKYKFETGSYATDADYVSTSYTVDNNNVVMVTYTDPETKEQTIFFINFNSYDVKIKLDTEKYPEISSLVKEDETKGYFVIEGTNYIKVQ